VRLQEGHVFISYVREDSGHVDRIQRVLQSVGVNVWRDKGSLVAGEDWKHSITEAIKKNALVFIACFSDNSRTKELTFQREELLLAAEQLRLRRPDKAWFIPVRLSDCELPHYDVGAGRTFDTFHRVDLIGENWDQGIAELVSGVLTILSPSADAEVPAPIDTDLIVRMKALLRDDRGQIELEDLVRGAANRTFGVLTDLTVFPSNDDALLNRGVDAVHSFLGQANRYWAEVSEIRDALILGCAWGLPSHNALWTMTIERIANSAEGPDGLAMLNELRRYPTTILLYAGGIAAVHRGNFAALKAIAWDAQSRTNRGATPMIAVGHPWLPFGSFELAAQVLAFQSEGEDISDDTIAALAQGTKGKRYTPISDHLHDALREPARAIIDDDSSYTETFDRTEVLFALLAEDAVTQSKATGGGYVWGPWYGSYTWRSKWNPDSGAEVKLEQEFVSYAHNWPPLQVGLFGGSAARAEAAFAVVIEGSQTARQHHY